MAKTPATHSGTCQCCGHFQKLPNGRLSKHGYTKEWGFFDGICLGAGHLPFEQDISLIQSFIAGARDQVDALKSVQHDLRQPATEPKAWIHEYRGSVGRTRGGYVWVMKDISMETHKYSGGGEYTWNTFSCIGIRHGTGPEQKCEIQTYGCESQNTLLEMCTLLNSRRADAYDKDIQNLERYIGWQLERITGWAPKALTPVK